MAIPLSFELRSAGLKVRGPTIRRENHMELPVGFEPTIRCLQGRCITVVLQEHDGIPCRNPTRISESVAPRPLH